VLAGLLVFARFGVCPVAGVREFGRSLVLVNTGARQIPNAPDP
jgi:hypothetical protein